LGGRFLRNYYLAVMGPYVILDTNVYQEMGMDIKSKDEYWLLQTFIVRVRGEFLLSDLVFEEFLDHFKIEIEKKKAAYNRSIGDLVRVKNFKHKESEFIDLSAEIEERIKDFIWDISTDGIEGGSLKRVPATDVSGLLMTKFIIENGKSNSQLKDLLIWDSVLKFASSRKKSKVYFITRDAGFASKQFQEWNQVRYSGTEVILVKSISELLQENGYNLSYVTEELILNKITGDRITRDAKKKLGEFLFEEYDTYADLPADLSKYFTMDLYNIEMEDYYSYYDTKMKIYRFSVHFAATITIVPIHHLINNMSDLNVDFITRNLLSYPRFNRPVGFHYRGQLDDNKKEIKNFYLDSAFRYAVD
jgi:hypothetical protein